MPAVDQEHTAHDADPVDVVRILIQRSHLDGLAKEIRKDLRHGYAALLEYMSRI